MISETSFHRWKSKLDKMLRVLTLQRLSVWSGTFLVWITSKGSSGSTSSSSSSSSLFEAGSTWSWRPPAMVTVRRPLGEELEPREVERAMFAKVLDPDVQIGQ